MRAFTRRITVALAATMLAGAFTPLAMGASAYTAIDGGETTFNKYLVIKDDAHIPAATFSYTIASGTAVAAGEGTSAVLAGPDADAIVIGDEGTTTFEADQQATAGTASDGIVNATDKKYATNEVAVDLSGVTFDEPGVYRYVITEAASSDDKITNDVTATRTLDVYVRDDGEGALAIEGYVLYSDTVAAAPNAEATNDKAQSPDPNGAEPQGAEKSVGYINTVNTQNLEFGKEVTGNQGSKDKYFKFTLTVTNAGAGTVVNVDKTGAVAQPAKTAATTYEAADMATANNVETLTADNAGKIEHDFYLSDGDYILVTGLPKGASYTLVEVNEDYDKTEGIAASIAKGGQAHAGAVTGTIADADVYTGFTNDRSGVIPTGVLLSVAPFAVVMAAGAAGIAFVAIRRSRAAE